MIRLFSFIVFLITDYISKDCLERFEPHFKERAKLGEPINIGRVVVLLSIHNMTDESFCKAVAVLIERIVVLAKPKLAKEPDHIINLIL